MEQDIPEFMLGHFEASDEKGKEIIRGLAAKFKDERAEFLQTTFVAKTQFQKDWNKVTGKRVELTPEEALQPMSQRYEAKAKEVAEKHNAYLRQEASNKPTDTRQAKRDEFLANLHSMRLAQKSKHTPKL